MLVQTPYARISFLALVSVLSFGCATSHHISDKEQRAEKNSAQIGQSLQNTGVMSSVDYRRWEDVGNKVGTQRKIDDADLDWALSTMQKPSTDSAEVAIRMMGLFMTAKTFTPLQHEKIWSAVGPLRFSKNIREGKWATACLKRVGVH